MPLINYSKNLATPPRFPTGMELYNSHKAGLQQSNRNQINEIIQEASKGSKFYLQEQKKLEKLKNKVEIYKKKLAHLNDSLHLLPLKRELDLKIEGMKDLLYNRKEEEVILHVDMDAFYAAVEALENPEYNSIPMVPLTPSFINSCRLLVLNLCFVLPITKQESLVSLQQCQATLLVNSVLTC